MKRHVSRMICASTCAMAIAMAGPGSAQTVTVDPSDPSPDGVTTFSTIKDAVLSFDSVEGSNKDNTDPNIVEVVAFGPFDEVIPGIFGSDVTSGGALFKAVLDSSRADNSVTIRGVGVQPLILAQYNYSFAALTARGDSALIFENAIIAQSETSSDAAASGQRHLAYAIDGGHVEFDNCVVTALPSGAAGYTSKADIPAGVLNGTVPLTGDYVYPQNFAGRSALAATNPAATTGKPDASIHLTNTVVTQWGDNALALYAQNAAELFLNEGTVIANNAQGIYIRPSGGAAPNMTIAGTFINRVLIADNGGNHWINLLDAGNVSISECNIIGRPGNNCIIVDGSLGSLSIEETVFADGERGSGGSTAILFNAVPGSLVLDELTIIDHRHGIITNTLGFSGANALTISNSILGNRTNFANGITNEVNAINCAFPASGPVAVTNPPFEVTVNETNCITDDPEFSNTDWGDSGFVVVRSAAYATANSGGGPLDGAMTYVPAGTFSTVTVDATDENPNHISTFRTIQEAMLSFDEFNGGPNSTAGEPVTIEITSFGPYDEVLPAVFESNVGSGGLRCKIPQSMSPMTIKGVGVKPLILAQEVYNWSGLSVRGPVEVVYENVVAAPSVTAPPARYLSFAWEGGKVTFNNSTVLTLPASAAAATSIEDLPAGYVDGTAAFADASVQPPANGGRGILVAQAAGSQIELVNSVITQCGYADAEYWPMLAQDGGTIRLSEGTAVAHNSSGIFLRDNGGAPANLIIEGAPGNRVYFHENNYQGRGWIYAADTYGTISITECDFWGPAQDFKATPNGRPNSAIYVIGAGTDFSLTESTLMGGQRTNPGGSIGITFDVAPSNLTLGNLTFEGHRYAFITGTTMAYTIEDSIFANVHNAFANNDSVVNAVNCAFQAEGDGAITGLSFDTTVNESGSVYADPLFTSVVYGESGFAEVTNDAYVDAASDGSPLRGGGTYNGPASSVHDWMVLSAR